MLLDERKRSNEQVIAGSYQIYIEEQMIPDKAIDSFIISDCVSGSEFYDDFEIGIFGYRAFGFVEKKDVVGICEELIVGVELRVIGDCENFGAGVVEFDLSEIY